MEISIQTDGLLEHGEPDEMYRLVREIGFDGVDWSLYQAWDREKVKKRKLEHCIFEDSMEEIFAHYREELDAIRGNGLRIVQAHAPFPLYVKNFPEFNEYAAKICRQCLRFCGEVGVKYLVVHGISLEIGDETQNPDTIRRMNLELYESMIPILRQNEVTVCLENLFTGYEGCAVEGVCSDPTEAIEYIDYLNNRAGKKCFALCLDTGHLNVLGKSQKLYIQKLGSRIRALHLHDNNGVKDQHFAPYAGTIRWDDVVDGLREIGYAGTLNFETFKQLTRPGTDREIAAAWLRMIYEVGEVFRSRITEEKTERR